MTKVTISAQDAKKEFSELINRVSHYKEHIIITRRSKEIVALIPIEDLLLIEESQNKTDLQEAVESLKQARSGDLISLQQLKKELG